MLIRWEQSKKERAQERANGRWSIRTWQQNHFFLTKRPLMMKSEKHRFDMFCADLGGYKQKGAFCWHGAKFLVSNRFVLGAKISEDYIAVVYIRGCTPVKIFFRLRLQNLFPGVHPRTVLREMAMVSMSTRCSKGGGLGFNVGALFLW